MGHSHAVSGALAWCVAGPLLASRGLVDLDPSVYATGALITAGAALLPDLDHPDATIAHSLGPLTQGVAVGVAAATGGHRKGTHTLLAAAAVWFAMWALAVYAGMPGQLAVTFLLAALALKALHLAPTGGLWSWAAIALQSAAVTGVVYLFGPTSWAWLPWAVTLGYITHLVGDSLAGSAGVPWLLPLTRRRFAVPLLPSTGGLLETKVVVPLMGLAVIALAWTQFTGSPLLGDPFPPTPAAQTAPTTPAAPAAAVKPTKKAPQPGAPTKPAKKTRAPAR